MPRLEDWKTTNVDTVSLAGAASLRTLERETGWYMSRDTTTFIDTAYPPPVPATAPALPKGVLRKSKQQIGLFVPECMR